MVIMSTRGSWNKTCADIAYYGAPYGENATYTSKNAYVPTLRLPGIVPHLKLLVNFEHASSHNFFRRRGRPRPITFQSANLLTLIKT